METSRKILDAILVLAPNGVKLMSLPVRIDGESSIHTNSFIVTLIESQYHFRRYPGRCNTQYGVANPVQVFSKLATGLNTLGNHS